MKRLVFAVVVILVLVTFSTIGCAKKEHASPSTEEGQEVASSCVACHTDKDTLKEVASPEPEEKTSEATSGEG